MQIPDLPDFPTDLTALARLLCLPPTWQVQDVDLDAAPPIVYATLADTYRPPEACGHCGERCWHHLDLTVSWHYARSVGGRATVVRLMYQRFGCRSCGRSRGHGYPTVLPVLQEEIADHAVYHTLSDTVRTFGIGYELTRSTMLDVFRRRLAQRVVEPPQYVAIDVTHKGKLALCMVVDVARGELLEVLDGAAKGSLTGYLDSVAGQWPDLRCVAIDPDKRAKAVIEQALPGVPIVLDRYHVVQIANRRLLKYLGAYKQQHGVTADGRILINPALDSYAAVAARLVQGGHGRVLELADYVRSLRVVYEQASAAEALAAWDAWRDRMPPELVPYLGRPVQDLNEHWRAELCAAVEYRVQSRQGPGMVLVGTNMVEALHNRARRLMADSRRMRFEPLRMRLLLMKSGAELDDRHRLEREQLRLRKRAS